MNKFSFIYVAFVLGAFAPLALATPEREVRVREQLLGSNADGFIILRTEVDNLGNHYMFNTKRLTLSRKLDRMRFEFFKAQGSRFSVVFSYFCFLANVAGGRFASEL